MKSLLVALLMSTGTLSLTLAQQPFYDVTAGNGNGVRFWDQSGNYKIHMGTGSEYFFGPVQDYSIKMNMNSGSSQRGWTWGVIGVAPVAAINTLGNMQIAGALTASAFKLVDPVTNWNIGFGVNGDPARFISADAINSAIDTDPLELVSRGSGVIVGTSSSIKFLQVYGSLRANNNFRLDGPSGMTHSEMQFYRADGAKFASIGQGNLSASNSTFDIQHFNGNDIRFLNTGVEQLRIQAATGNVGIGTTSPNQKLTVNGTIYGKEVKVDLNVPGPDYVFESGYSLPSLDEIKSYIRKNKHLPEVPSAEQMDKEGVNLSEMNMILLRKIEELTLYIIDQENRIKALEKQKSSQK